MRASLRGTIRRDLLFTRKFKNPAGNISLVSPRLEVSTLLVALGSTRGGEVFYPRIGSSYVIGSVVLHVFDGFTEVTSFVAHHFERIP